MSRTLRWRQTKMRETTQNMGNSALKKKKNVSDADRFWNRYWRYEMFAADHVLVTCFKHWRSYFQFESEMVSSFNCWISLSSFGELITSLHIKLVSSNCCISSHVPINLRLCVYILTCIQSCVLYCLQFYDLSNQRLVHKFASNQKV